MPSAVVVVIAGSAKKLKRAAVDDVIAHLLSDKKKGRFSCKFIFLLQLTLRFIMHDTVDDIYCMRMARRKMKSIELKT